MSFFVIQDFRLGLDARKHQLSLPPDALFVGKNVNINRGGEIETCKDFVQKYALPANKTFGMLAAGGQLFTFGSVAAPGVPAGVQYQRLVHPDGLAMTGVVFASVMKGKPYVIASYTGGVIEAFYNGVLVADWSTGAVGGTMASMADVAAHFSTVINTDTNYSATPSGNIVTVTGQPGVTFAVSASTVQVAPNDQFVGIGLSRAAVAPVAEVLSHATITLAGVPNGGQVSSVKVNGVEALGATVTQPAGGTDAGFASLIAAQINSDISTPDYTATVAGAVVTIYASPGTGATPNTFVVATTNTMGAGVVTTTNMAGGVTAVAGVAQISTLTFGGTFAAGIVFSVNLGGTVFGGTSGAAGEQATCAIPWQDKMYAIADQNLFGSAVDDPSTWNSGTGSFVSDMSSQIQGAETLTALGIFQNQLAIFARNTTQIWNVDPDPNNNALVQTLQNIGTMAPKTVLAFGDQDLFFLSDTGLRSLKVRLVTVNNATMSDIGSPVDPLIIAAIAAAGGAASKACAVIDPVDGRYLVHIGTTTYAFSFYPSGKVSAWTTYEFGLAITDFAVVAEQVYARAGDTIYLIGGDNNATYTSQVPVVQTPFLNARQIESLKHFTGADFIADGVWSVDIATNPNQPSQFERIGILTGSTFGGGELPIQGESQVISLQFTGKGDQKYARIAGITLYYQPEERAA